jgi:anti-sigma B factor antagonist
VRPVPDPDFGSPALKRRALLISTRRYGDMATFIALLGELDVASADELDAVIRDAEETDVGRIVVDLSGVSFIDSTSLSVLLRAKKRSDGRQRCIPSCHDAVTRLLQVTGTLAMVD